MRPPRKMRPRPWAGSQSFPRPFARHKTPFAPQPQLAESRRSGDDAMCQKRNLVDLRMFAGDRRRSKSTTGHRIKFVKRRIGCCRRSSGMLMVVRKRGSAQSPFSMDPIRSSQYMPTPRLKLRQLAVGFLRHSSTASARLRSAYSSAPKGTSIVLGRRFTRRVKTCSKRGACRLVRCISPRGLSSKPWRSWPAMMKSCPSNPASSPWPMRSNWMMFIRPSASSSMLPVRGQGTDYRSVGLLRARNI